MKIMYYVYNVFAATCTFALMPLCCEFVLFNGVLCYVYVCTFVVLWEKPKEDFNQSINQSYKSWLW